MIIASRRVPRSLFVVVVAGAAAALLWSGLKLQRIFVEERDTAKAAIAARQGALEQYAVISLERRLKTLLADARPRIDAALADPLQEDPRLLMVEDGKQVLPRLAQYVEGAAQPVRRFYDELAADAASAEGPWLERLALLGDLRTALERSDAPAITTTVRSFLNHQAHFIVPVTKDIPYRIYFLEMLMDGSTPDHALLQALLRDGLRGTQGRRLVGLQPLVLTNRDRFTRPDFEFLKNRVTMLSRRANVVHDDFDVLAGGGSAEPLKVPAALKSAALIANGSFYAVPLEATSVYGVAVDITTVLQDITSEMKEGGLLAGDDALYAESLHGDVLHVTHVPVKVRSTAFAAEAAVIDGRYALKTATGVALGVLLSGIAALTALLYRREQKYLEGKASVIATVSHELRTPIASLRLMGETLERRLEGVDTARDFPSRIVGEAERLSFLVENILSFNRLERVNVETHLQSATMSELLEGARSDAAAFTRKPVNIRIEDEHDVVLYVDGELMKLLFSNLINNSCKYNQRDSVYISLRAERDGDRIVLRFTDNGTGIPKDEWESVFTEFVRSRSSVTSTGFGLGLALCRRIMRLHGGTIRVAHSSDTGTTFEMVFGVPYVQAKS